MLYATQALSRSSALALSRNIVNTAEILGISLNTVVKVAYLELPGAQG